MSNIAPPLTREGFLHGCSQPGPARPMKDTIIHEGIKITFTASGILFSAADDAPFTARQTLRKFSEAIENVRCLPARVSRENQT
jgi:hypothetical protein